MHRQSKQVSPFLLFIMALALILTACHHDASSATAPSVPAETESATVPSVPTTLPTEPAPTSLLLEGTPVEDVIVYFNEVCLDSEFTDGGDPSLIQKWAVPIRYLLEGDYTPEDAATVTAFADWLNALEGFPGITPADDSVNYNLRIRFCTREELVSVMGPNFEGMDGGVTFWYEDNEIYDATVCLRTDLDQQLRNSVILEELYNGLGPVQDTVLRPDSIIWQEFSQPQWLTPMDALILELLYHPDILPGMNAWECEQVIRRLYN